MFGTVVNTPDNVRTIIGNNKIFSDTIQNFSANPNRRVDLTAPISNDVDHRAAIRVYFDSNRLIQNARAALNSAFATGLSGRTSGDEVSSPRQPASGMPEVLQLRC